MSQATLFCERAASDFDAAGFAIGWDHAHHRVVPPPHCLHERSAVRRGWQAGRAAFGARTLRASPQVRRWLELRLHAWLRGVAFEAVQVTPNHLAQLRAAVCPVTREPLDDSTAVIERVFDGAGYAAGNLTLISARAAAAKAGRGWSDALAQARDVDAGRADDHGLDAAQWTRLAVLMSFATPLAHAQVASLPLVVMPPNRLRLLNAVQALQALLTLQFARPGFARRSGELAAAMPAGARDAFQVFVHTLLARRIAAGAAEPLALRHALEDAWRDPLVQRRWQRLALQLDEAECERLVKDAERRSRDAGWQWLPRDAATDGWALASKGHTRPAAAHAGATPDGRRAA